MADATTVKVVVQALTESAERAINNVGNEIAGMADDAAVGQSTLDQFSDEATEAGASSSFLAGRLDSLKTEFRKNAVGAKRAAGSVNDFGDESLQAGAKAAAASGLFSTLSISTTGLAFSLSSASSVLTLSLIPAIAALLTTIAPLTAVLGAVAGGLAGVAAGAAAVVGSGLVAFGQKRAKANRKELQTVKDNIAALKQKRDTLGELSAADKERLAQLKDKKDKISETTSITGALGQVMGDLKQELTPLVTEFGKEFIPLIEDAIDGIPALVQNIFDAMGGMDEFADAIRTFGEVGFDVIPGIVSGLMDMGRMALPVLGKLFGFLLRTGGRAMNSMVRVTRELAPQFRQLANAFLDALPAIMRFGTMVLKTVLPALSKGTRGFGDLLRQVMKFTQTSAFDNLVSAIQRLVKAAIDFVKSEDFAEILDELKASAKELGPEINTLIDRGSKVLKVLGEEGPDLIDGATAALDSLLDIINELLPVLKDVIKFVAGLAKWFAEFTDKSEKAEQSGVNFFHQMLQFGIVMLTQLLTFLGKWGIKVKNFFVGLWNGLIKTTADFLEKMINMVITKVNKLLSELERFEDPLSKVLGEDIKFEQLERVDFSGDLPTLEKTELGKRQEARAQMEVINRIDANLEIERGEGDQFNQFLDDRARLVAETEETKRKRQIDRKRGSPE